MSPTAAAPHIVLRGVDRGFKDGTVQALQGIDLDVGHGEFVTVVGPSGCGKTTLLRIVDGLITPDAGEVLVAGRPPVPGPGMGMVFQQARLLPWRSVRQNVEFPLQLRRVPKAERAARAWELLESVGLRDFADAFPHELSGGMQQRVGVCRALAADPDVLLMDEPFAALDAMTREFMRVDLLQLWSRRRTAVLFVTHDIDEAIFLSQRIVLLRPRPGRVEEILDVDLPEPRWDHDVRSTKIFHDLREHLWQRIRAMVGGLSAVGGEPA